jgi:putative Mg2+ transporter-C (MgtC) family protein
VSLDYTTILIRLIVGAALGAIIGFERSYHGRPAGLRTHALVSSSSTLLMLFTAFQWELLSGVPIETLRVDPTRMAQGIMTGIGFLGAGVIIKEKLTVRGLTTATSIWMSASIGIVVGMGFFSAAGVATILTLLILSVFGWFERKLPTYAYSHLTVRCKRQESINKAQLEALVNKHHFKASGPSYHLEDEGRFLQYSLTIHTRNNENLHTLADDLINNQLVTEFSLVPLGGR